MKRLTKTEAMRKERVFVGVLTTLLLIKYGYPLLKQAIYYLFN